MVINMMIYQNKKNLVYSFHPIASIVFMIGFVVLALMFYHPLYLTGLFIALGLTIKAAQIVKEWSYYLRFSLWLMAVIVIVNTIFVNSGTTELFFVPLPLLGNVKVTLEAIAFSLVMGLRMLIVMSAFCLYTYTVDPDKALRLLGRFGNKSILIVVLALRLFPLVAHDFKRIVGVYKSRGLRLDKSSVFERVRNILPIMNALLLSCLERSMQLAEALWLKGYGSSKRTHYNPGYFRPRDAILLIAVVCAVVTGLWVQLKGWSGYVFYPRLQGIDVSKSKPAVLISLLLAVPAVLNWGWVNWPVLKSKI